MKLNYPLRFCVTLLAILCAAWFWYSDGVDRGLDLKGGASLSYKLDELEVAEIEAKNPMAEPLLDTVRVIEERINTYGLKDVKVDALGGYQFEVQFPGKEASEVNRIKKLLTQLGRLEFRIVANNDRVQAETLKKEREGDDYKTSLGYKWYPARPKRDAEGNELPVTKPDLLVEIPEATEQAEVDRLARRRIDFTARQKDLQSRLPGASEEERPRLELELERVQRSIDEVDRQIREETVKIDDIQRGEYFTGQDLDAGELMVRRDQPPRPGFLVAFAFEAGRKTNFGDFTERYKHRLMAIIIDGQYESAPEIQNRLDGGGVITGGGAGFTEEEATELVTVLRSGSLSVGITLTQEWSIGPSLGEEAISRGILATAIGLAGVVLFMLGTYLFPGLVAVFALLMNLLIIMGALAFAKAELSLPGIAGVILTVGMAVDANILVFERIREERKLGKTLLQAVKAGYDRAFVTIVDANVTTLFSAVVLFMITTGQVRGFAAVLVVGILASMFTALFVTKTIFGWLIERGLVTEMRMPQIIGQPSLSYMRIRLPMIVLSLGLIAAGVFTFWAVGDKKYDIEFVGGQRVVVAFNEPVPIKEVKEKILKEYESATVVSIKSDTAEASALDQASANDRYQITIEAAKDEAGQEAALEFLSRTFADRLMPPPVVTKLVSDASQPKLFEVRLNFQRDVTEADIRTLLEKIPGLTDLEVDTVKGRTAEFHGVFEEGEERLHEAIQVTLQTMKEGEKLTGMSFSEPFPMKNFVDPQTAQRHRDDAMKAVLISLVFQIIYIYVRFKGASFGFAAVLALVHDVLIVLGAIAFFGSDLVNVKINLPIIAAILTLIGYSMNDSIVVFDRIRENLKRGRQNLSEVIDLSVNQTMGRSLRTSVTTFVVVLVLFIVNFGAASSVLEGFAFVLMVGVITGTYSSIFVASPMLMFLPWHYIRGKGGLFWGLVALSVLGGVCFLFAEGQSNSFFWFSSLAALCAYPIYFLADLGRWLLLDEPDRALNIALRRQGARGA